MKKIVLFTLTFYQKIISPVIHQLLGVKEGYGCRHTPSCSTYSQEVIRRYGVFKGTFLSLRRVINCQPFFSI